MGFFVIISLKRGDSMQNITADILKKVIHQRPQNSFKGTFGKVLIVGVIRIWVGRRSWPAVPRSTLEQD